MIQVIFSFRFFTIRFFVLTNYLFYFLLLLLSDFCPLLNLGLMLEHMYPTEPNSDGIINCFALSSSPEASKRRAGKLLKEVFESDEFKLRFGSDASVSLDLWLGSHSLRKSAATHARQNGCSRDEIDLRGRWKKKKRQVDVYIDTEVPYPDARVAGALCVGGPITYQLVAGCGVDDGWITNNVVPEIFKRHFCKKTAVVLGRAVLWACIDPMFKSFVPDDLLRRVTSAYERARLLDAGENPVKKVGLVVVGSEGQLFIDMLPEPDADGDLQQPSGAGVMEANLRRRRQNAELQAVFSQLAAIKRQNELLHAELEVMRTNFMGKMKRISDSLNRIAIPHQFTVQTHVNSNNQTNNTTNNENSNSNYSILFSTGSRSDLRKAKLYRNPKSLYILWQEYEHGVGNRKAAKDFSRDERGKCRYSYCRRNVFWDLVSTMVRRGHTANSAIDKIYIVYGHRTSVTDILKNLVRDKQIHHRQFL